MPARRNKDDPKTEVLEAPSAFTAFIRRRIEELREADEKLPQTDTSSSKPTFFARAIGEWKELREAERRSIVDPTECREEGTGNEAAPILVEGSTTTGSLGHPLDLDGCAAQASLECEAELLDIKDGGEQPTKKRELEESKEGKKKRRRKKKKKKTASSS